MAKLNVGDEDLTPITGDGSTIPSKPNILPRDTSYISDEDAFKFQSANNIRADAISVRTSAGSIVWIDPSYSELVISYQTGIYTGNVNEIPPQGVLAIMFSTTEFRTYETDLPIPTTKPKSFPPNIPIIPPIVPNLPPPSEPKTDPTIPPIVPNLPPPADGPIIPPIVPDIPPPADGPIIPPPLPYEPPPPDPSYVPNRLYIAVSVHILPYVSPWPPAPVTIPWSLTINAIPMPLLDATMLATKRILNGAVNNYFDDQRVGKTILNFGQDYQSLLLNWQLLENKNDPSTYGNVIVKLYAPLPPEISIKTELWISRELSSPYVDQLFVVFLPAGGVRVYLRPPNRGISVQSLDGHEVNNVTNQTLFSTGSSSQTDLTDPVIEQWFTTALEGVELNINYNDFNDFVFYSSATARLNAFKQKMFMLEEYNTILTQQSSSMATSSVGLAGFTGSAAYGSYERISDQRMDLIRSFDGYERFLYYNSGSAYSSSFSNDNADNQFYYIKDSTWPKINGANISVASASNASLYSLAAGVDLYPEGDYSGLVSWWDGITFIASEYDKQNVNRLTDNLPDYLKTDNQSDDFLTFVNMIGHQFDTLKSYADAMPQIYDRNSNPLIGMSQDTVWNVATSFGIDLPNQYAVNDILDYTIGNVSNTSPVVYRQMAAETWKRFLHNQIYLLKTKGTAASLRGLMNVYGILPTTIQIRESAAPSFQVSASYELVEEQTNTLLFSSGTHVNIPYTSSAETVQVRFATTSSVQSVLYNIVSGWGVGLLPSSGTYGRVALINAAGTTIVSSSQFEIFGGDYYTVTVQRNGSSASMWTQYADNAGDIINSSIVSGALGTFRSGSTLSLGMSGSAWGTSYQGNIDEFRLWTEVLTSTTIERHVKYPGLYNGNTTTSARDHLLARLSFNKPQNLYTSSLTNESPYIRVTGHASIYNTFPAIGFANNTIYPYSMDVITRNILRYAPNIGAQQYVSNKITVADAPVLRYVTSGSTNIPVLSNEKSMVDVYEKPDNVNSNNIIGFYFSIQDAINDSMIRTLGNIDLQSYIGDPSDLYRSNYSSLKALNELYWNSYAYTYDYNAFVDFVQNLLQPMFTQAKSMVPARSKLLTGIVLESPMLERNKIQWNLPEIDDTEIYYPDALTSQPNTVSGDFTVQDAIFEQTLENPLSSDYDVWNAEWDLAPNNTIDASLSSYLTSIDMLTQPNNDDVVGSDFLIIDSVTDEYAYYNTLLTYFGVSNIIQLTPSQLSMFTQLMASHTPAPDIPIQTGTNPNMPANEYSSAIEPYVDFLQISATNYFKQVGGVFRLLSNKTVRLDEAILTNAGTWTSGITYSANQFVIQTGVVGAGSEWNGVEFVCITPRSSIGFVSYVAPGLDTLNWRKVKYITVPTYIIRTATQINDLIQLTDPSAGYTPFTGYNRYHYRYFRDTATGTIRRNWYGCKTNDSNTFDGGPAVEIIASAGDILVVTDGAEPIQRTTSNSGPRLDVK